MEKNKDKYAERQEIVQDLIDRLVYLPNDELEMFEKRLKYLMDVYPIEYKKQFGMRIFEIPKPNR
jgi:hypothetical protein